MRLAPGINAQKLTEFADDVGELQRLDLPVGLGALEVGADTARPKKELSGFLHRAWKMQHSSELGLCWKSEVNILRQNQITLTATANTKQKSSTNLEAPETKIKT
jgi:hypothetical protein